MRHPWTPSQTGYTGHSDWSKLNNLTDAVEVQVQIQVQEAKVTQPQFSATVIVAVTPWANQR